MTENNVAWKDDDYKRIMSESKLQAAKLDSLNQPLTPEQIELGIEYMMRRYALYGKEVKSSL
jgi:hypothetical protein